jgi:hypothetical protein
MWHHCFENADMSIGPFFELPNTAASRLREVAARKGIRVRVETAESRAAEFYPGLYIFCSLLGRIQGRWRTSGDVCVFWLTSPLSHAFIPVLWPFDFHLFHRVEQVLLELGAHRTDPQF